MIYFMGIDVSQGNANSSRPPAYSVVIIDSNEKIIEKQEYATLSRIIRLSWDYKPKAIAVDNVYEIGGNERNFVRIASFLPYETEIIQTTVVEGTFYDLRDIAKSVGISIEGKPNPVKTAYINALLALRGKGTKIKLIEEKTKIIISRGRKLGPGGMSQNRYKRKIRGMLLQVAKDVKYKLDTHGFDYDMLIKRSKNGIEGATFVVYTSRESLFGIVKKTNTPDVIVDIRPVYRSKVEFFQKKEKRSVPLIVGIDPGIHVGVAVLDIYGRPLLLATKKSIDVDYVISEITGLGKPYIIASDVNPVPDAVKKIASRVGAKVSYPSKSPSIEEKQKISDEYAQQYNIKIETSHERDALSAAVKSFKEIESKIRQIEGYLRRTGIDIDQDKLMQCVLRGIPRSECIEAIIQSAMNIPNDDLKPSVAVQENKDKVTDKQSQEILYYKLELSRLKEYMRKLYIENEQLKKKIRELEINNNKEIMIDRKVHALTIENRRKGEFIVNEEKIIQELTREREKLKEVIDMLVNMKVKIVTNDNQLVSVKNGQLYVLGEKVDGRVAEYVGGDYCIIRNDVLDDIKILLRENIEQTSSNINITDLIKHYREERIERLSKKPKKYSLSEEA
ncbi:hypothetical protein HS7_21130 [Sulfolobales archaeon HS-7]|nr:hypothetical protein HS7_21130 [Sulfolobales archaeon HS-7]